MFWSHWFWIADFDSNAHHLFLLKKKKITSWCKERWLTCTPDLVRVGSTCTMWPVHVTKATPVPWWVKIIFTSFNRSMQPFKCTSSSIDFCCVVVGLCWGNPLLCWERDSGCPGWDSVPGWAALQFAQQKRELGSLSICDFKMEVFQYVIGDMI